MGPERWKRVEELYLDILEFPPATRAAELEKRCADDPELFREVTTLLDARDQAADFLLPPQLHHHIAGLGAQPSSAQAGSTVGPYEILAEIGAGAMGEVFRARDTRLNRLVALKILPAHFTHDDGRVARFRLEAQAASALNHPNIVTIFEIGQDGETWFIAAELIDGVTLRDRMEAGRLAVGEAIALTLQCVKALDAAHCAGIIHRDIKPENIMVRADGVVKVVDFGLARIIENGPAAVPAATLSGSVVGTPRYMSPEQVRGEKLDGRTDLFSLSAVLYELVYGAPAFPGSTTAEVFAALLSSEPPLGSGVLSAVLRRGLAKNRDARYANAGEFAADLARVDPRGSLTLTSTAARPLPKRLLPYLLLVLGLASAVGWYGWKASRTVPPEVPARLVPLTSFPGAKDYVAFSPDAQRIAFSWTGEAASFGLRHIYVKPVGEGAAVPLTSAPADDVLPAWSPDGTQIAFCRKGSDGSMASFVVSASGGAERRIATGGQGVSWSPDGKWLALAAQRRPQGSGLFLLSVTTGDRRALTNPEGSYDAVPVYSPDGQWIAFMRSGSDREVFVVPAAGGAVRQLTSDSRAKLERLAWTGDSREVVYSAQREYGGAGLWRVPIREGQPRRIYGTLDFAGNPAISSKGDRLAYTESWIDTNIYRSDAAGFSAAGLPQPFGPARRFIASSREDHSPNFSPDGQQVAFVSNRTGNSEIWIAPLEGGEERQLTRLEGFAGTPRWSPDGRSIAFDYITRGNNDIWFIPSSGGNPVRLTNDRGPDTKPAWSPDGAWIYFNSDRSGRPEVWKMRADGSMPSQVTFSGGREPLPSLDGRTIYYTKVVGPSSIWSVPAGGGPERPVSGMEAANRIGRLWGVVRFGIYFVSVAPDPAPTRIQFFDFQSRRLMTLGDWDRMTTASAPGVALSADGRHLLTVHTDQSINDLMMIENFR